MKKPIYLFIYALVSFGILSVMSQHTVQAESAPENQSVDQLFESFDNELKSNKSDDQRIKDWIDTLDSDELRLVKNTLENKSELTENEQLLLTYSTNLIRNGKIILGIAIVVLIMALLYSAWRFYTVSH